MKTIITMILLLVAEQASAAEQSISVQHDSVRGVICWILNDKGISCLPDGSLQEHTATTTDKNEAARAFQAGSMPENEQLPTTHRISTEVFQL